MPQGLMADPDNPAFPRSLDLEQWSELAGARVEPVTEGMSGALLFRVTANASPLRYLKLARGDAALSLRGEIERTRWLAAYGFRVPPILHIEDRQDEVAMLTQAVPGSSSEQNPLPARLIGILARGLAALHALPLCHCPFDESLDVRLAKAAAAVSSGRVDTAAFEPRNRDTAPEILLEHLQKHRPRPDIVVVHGDATLTNLIVDDDGNLGFVDCGNVGRGDRYLDLSVLVGEIEEHHGADAVAQFIRTYGLSAWDAAKARYFSDLYELF